jgi:hypothetical protein
VGPRADEDNVEKRKFFIHRDSNSDPSVVDPVASRYTDCAISDLQFLVGARNFILLPSVQTGSGIGADSSPVGAGTWE